MVARRRWYQGLGGLLVCFAAGWAWGVPYDQPHQPALARICLPNPGNYAVYVTPYASPVSWPSYTNGHTSTFTVKNTGLCAESYSFSYTASGPISGVSLDKTGAYLAKGASTTVTATYNVGAPGSGVLALTATGAVGGDQSTGSYNVTVAKTVAVTPKGGTSATRAPNAAGYSETFTVKNVGSASDTYTLTCIGASGATCTGTVPTSLALQPNVSGNVTASYYTGPAGTGTLNLVALGTNQVADTGSFSVPIVTAGVAVRPDSGTTAARLANSGPFQDVFTIQNTGAGTKTFTITCGGSSNVTCSGVSASSATLAAGDSTTVTATYSVLAVGTGTLTLTATAPDASHTGSYRIGVVSSAQQAPAVALAAVNAGNVSQRDLCFTIALGPAAASECGDLRIVHPLPTTRTMNKARMPTLLYNSQFAHPYPLVAALVTLPTTAIPDSIEATLTVNGTVQQRGQWAGSQWGPGRTRRIALRYDGLSTPTGPYSYTLEVASVYGSTRLATDSTGQLLIVNRQSSPFGTGWWLAGLEQLNVGTMLWVGGDGSAHQYQPAGTNVWAGPNVSHPDTLKQVLNGGTTYYVRYLPKGVQVWFNAQGQHVYTYNRQGHRTTFGYDQVTGVLDSINLPVIDRGTGYAGPSYQFAYTTSAPYRLLSVTAPRIGSVVRTTMITQSGGFITQIQDPDAKAVQFAPVASVPELIQSRTDRRGTQTTFTYDTGNRTAGNSVSPNPNQTIVLRITAQQSLGLPGQSVDPGSAFTLISGPRTDSAQVSQVWEDRWSQPTLIQDTHGSQTRLGRGDARWPGLVTEVDHPNGWRVTATYDGRGNLASTADYGFGGYPMTTYQWDQAWDALTKVVRPEGDSLLMAYDPATGNRLWQKDGRGDSTRVTFTYGAANELIAITPPGTPAESIAYTYVTGNVMYVKTSKGFDTQYTLDDAGRVIEMDSRLDTLLKNPPSAGTQTYQSTWTYYDILDRDTLHFTIAPNPQVDLNTWPETLFVRTFYNPNGQVDSLFRWSGPDAAHIGKIRSAWRYDAVGRVVAEIAPDGFKDSTVYDLAGNPDTVVTRNGKTITMVYDALNRVLTRSLPEVDYGSRHTFFGIARPDPIKDYAPYTIPAETRTFTYDALGRVLTANNGDAQVKRTYYPDGLLDTDSLRIQTVNRDDWTKHVYGLRTTYDRDGRRIALGIPQQLAVNGGALLSYTYVPQLGALLTVSDLLGSSYRFTYDAKAELTSTVLPSSYGEYFSYDPDGRLAADSIKNLGATGDPRIQTQLVRAATFAYDGQGRAVWSGDHVWAMDTLVATYSGLGHLTSSQRVAYPTCSPFYGCGGSPQRWQQLEFDTLDALGNRTRGWIADTTGTGGSGGNVWSTYQQGTGRLSTDRASGVATNYSYDSAGAVVFQSNMGTPAEERASYFAADGSLRAVNHRWAVAQNAGITGAQEYHFEEFRYDALGRRIWARSENWCNDVTMTVYSATACRTSILRRTIWDDDEELVEIQMPWGLQSGVDSTITTTPSWWENDVNPVSLGTSYTAQGSGDPNPYFGYVVHVAGPTIDQPLAITRVNYAMALDLIGRQSDQQVVAPFAIEPFWNTRGDAAVGVFGNGYVRLCTPATSTSSCVGLDWPWTYSAYDAVRGLVGDSWQGTLLANKRDASGLSYMRNRYYDPATGRFTQEDPIGLAGGLNLYGYAGGDPINLSDPLGLCADDGGDEAADQGNQGNQGGDSTKAKPKPKPQPKRLSCHYQISTGHFECQEPGGQWNVVDAYGSSGLSGGFKNNPAMESVKDRGPIPVGTYDMTPMPGNYHNLGPNTIVLTPVPGPNALFDRTLLRIHSGTRSTGCILLGPNARSTIAGHGGGTLTVTP